MMCCRVGMQDAWADVKLLLLLNIVILFSGGLAKRILVDGEAPVQAAGYWSDIYDVWHPSLPSPSLCMPTAPLHITRLKVMLIRVTRCWSCGLGSSRTGQTALPVSCSQSPWPPWAWEPLPSCWRLSNRCCLPCHFSLASFEGNGVHDLLTHSRCKRVMGPKQLGRVCMQIVLEILTENVSRGSEVYEEGHVLVLAWAVTQRDREVIWKILSQVLAISLYAHHLGLQ